MEFPKGIKERRKILVGCIAFVAYAFLVYSLLYGNFFFWDMSSGWFLLAWTALSIVFAFILHFVAIETKEYPFLYVLEIVGACMVIVFFLILAQGISYFTLMLLLVFHVGILTLLYALTRMYDHYRWYNGRTLMNHGIRTYMIYIAIIIGGLLASTRQSVDLNCSNLYDGLSHIERFLPAAFVASEFTETSFPDATVADVVGIQQEQIDELMADLSLLSQAKQLQQTDDEEESTFLFGLLTRLEDTLVKDVAHDKSIVNEGFCNVVIQHIQTKKGQPLFVYSASVLLFFFIYPLLKIASFFVGIVAFILFTIATRLKIYVREEAAGNIEHIG